MNEFKKMEMSPQFKNELNQYITYDKKGNANHRNILSIKKRETNKYNFNNFQNIVQEN